MRTLPAGLALRLAGAGAGAEQSVRGDGFIVHWSALHTTARTPEIAQRRGVERRASHALLVLGPRRDPGDGAAPVEAAASGWCGT